MGVTMRDPLSRDRAIVLVSTIAAILLANIFFWSHKSNIVYDARGYYELSKVIGANGLFHFSDDKHTMDPGFHSLFGLRTYGYPLFVALCALFTNHDERVVQITVFSTQLLIYILMCYCAAKCSQAVFKTPGFSTWLYVCLVLNPFLLIYTTELLTDLLSAVTICFVLLLLLKAGLDVRQDDEPSAGLPDRRR